MWKRSTEQRANDAKGAKRRRQHQKEQRSILQHNLNKKTNKLQKKKQQLHREREHTQALQHQLNLLSLQLQELQEEKEREIVNNRENQIQTITHWKSMVERYEERKEVETEKQKQLITNMNTFLSQIPNNHKAHPLVLKYFTEGLSEEDACDYFAICPATVKNAQHLPTPERVLDILAWKGKREMITGERRDLLVDILDELIPVVSGRDFRIRWARLKTLYSWYVEKAQLRAPTLKPIGYNKFKELLSKERVHKGKKPTLCEYCHEIFLGSPLTEQLRAHLEAKERQSAQYLRLKRVLAEGKLPEGSALIIQDFTQVNLEGGFVQVMIVCVYTYDPSAKDKIKRNYFDFVGQKGLKNTITFVVASWAKLLEEPLIKSLLHLYVWSDGGPKHYKISSNMILFSVIQEVYPQFKICYNFYASHHGHSVCDGLAQHGKKKLEIVRCELGERIINHNKIVEHFNTLPNRKAVPVPRDVYKKLAVSTLSGITSYHQFWFPAPRTIHANVLSSFNEDAGFSCSPQVDRVWEVEMDDYLTVYHDYFANV